MKREKGLKECVNEVKRVHCYKVINQSTGCLTAALTHCSYFFLHLFGRQPLLLKTKQSILRILAHVVCVKHEPTFFLVSRLMKARGVEENAGQIFIA